MDLRIQLAGEIDAYPNVLRNFEPNYNADRELEDYVKLLNEKAATFKVDKYSILQNVSDVGEILDRLLTMRRDIWEIDSTRVRTAINYKNAIKQAEAEHELTIAKAGDDNIEAITAASLSKLTETKRMITDLESLHGEPGNSLNFSERLAKNRNIFKQDIESCHVRCIAVVDGISSCFGVTDIIERPKPGELKYATFDGASHLDDWVAWHRKLSRALEGVIASQGTHEIAIPLSTPYLFYYIPPIDAIGLRIPRRDEEEKRLIENIGDRIKEAIPIEFKINPSQPIGQLGHGHTVEIPLIAQHITLDEISMRVVVPNDNYRFRWQFQLNIFYPNGVEPTMVIASTGEQPLNWTSSPAIKNRPAEGNWAIEFIGAMKDDTSDTRQANRDQWPILDVILHLRVTTTNYIGIGTVGA